jgi:hypothetical protein
MEHSAKGTKLKSSLADLIYIDSKENQCAIHGIVLQKTQ